ncbi:unnamed protein product [Calicophoron daubneyi]|uniref:FERM domain-containing protein n=1 Tax=Calicophoron daubneyi TaxID=300641 RepID=A0AAV2T6B0_CALDB
MQQFDESRRSERAKERAQRRRKHREAGEELGDDEPEPHRLFRRERQDDEVDPLGYQAGGSRARRQLTSKHPTERVGSYSQSSQPEQISDDLAYPDSENPEYVNDRRAKNRSERYRSSKQRRPLEEHDYVNAEYNRDQGYPEAESGYRYEEGSFDDNQDQAFDENYPEARQSVRSSSQHRTTYSSRHAGSITSPRPSVAARGDSALGYERQSTIDGAPRALGGSGPQFWNPEVEPGPPVNQPVAEQPGTANKPLKKFWASFRKLKIKNKTSASQPDLSTAASGELVTARVVMLDGEEVSYNLDRNDTGDKLFGKVCQTADIVEADYFGLTYVSNKLKTWFWLDLEKRISKQLRNGEQWIFSFQVKFYPPEPTLLQEDITRYQLTLQVRQDIYTGKLPCSWVTQALLGSFMVQAEIGDYDEAEHGGSTDYLKEFEFVPSPTPQLLQKIAELHKTHIGMKPNQADIKYLETAKRLELYGIDLHPCRDTEDVDIYLGVGFHGVVIYRDRLRIGRFAWPKILRISYKKNNFYLKIRPDNTEPVEVIIGFRLLNHHLANRLWKAAVEHHAFFRLKEAVVTKSANTAFNPTHLYTGHTFFQYRTMNINRPHPQFNRSLMKRRTASMPTGLNQAHSIHSLNRSHPRDMTVGRTQETDLLGPRRIGSAQNSLAGTGHAGSTGQLYGTARGAPFAPTRDDRSQMSRQMSIASASDASYVPHSRSNDYVNYQHRTGPSPARVSDIPEEHGSYMSGSVAESYSAQRSYTGSRSGRQPTSRHSEQRVTSPMYVNAPRGKRGSNSEVPSSELSQQNSRTHQSHHRVSNSEGSSSRTRPPKGGVPALGGAVLPDPGARRPSREPPQNPEPRARRQREPSPVDYDQDEPIEYDDDDVAAEEEYSFDGYEDEREPQPEFERKPSRQRIAQDHTRRRPENTELML